MDNKTYAHSNTHQLSKQKKTSRILETVKKILEKKLLKSIGI